HEQFMEKIAGQIEQNNSSESNYRFGNDVRKLLLEKTAVRLPENLLKRWLYEGNDGKFTMEQIEKDFPAFLDDFRWQLVREYIMKTCEIKVEKDDMVQSAVAMARYQFAMYGLNDVPDEHLVKYAESMLSNEKEARNLYERAEDNKVISYIREHVTIDVIEE
ncbi:MAG: trigger factor, partial [Bacteroidales bacterium]|nr:trigger factor [Bacteroidales bacterium]